MTQTFEKNYCSKSLSSCAKIYHFHAGSDLIAFFCIENGVERKWVPKIMRMHFFNFVFWNVTLSIWQDISLTSSIVEIKNASPINWHCSKLIGLFPATVTLCHSAVYEQHAYFACETFMYLLIGTLGISSARCTWKRSARVTECHASNRW